MSKDITLADVFAEFDKAEAERKAFPQEWTTFKDVALQHHLGLAYKAYEAKFGKASVLIDEPASGPSAGGRGVSFVRPVRVDVSFAPRPELAKVAVRTTTPTDSGFKWNEELFKLSDLTPDRIASVIVSALRARLIETGVIYNE